MKRKIRAADDDEEPIVRSQDNRVYFTGSVTGKSMNDLLEELDKVREEVLNVEIKYGVRPVIYLFVQSVGGDAFAGISAMDHIKNMDVEIHTVVDGLVASAATFLVLGGSYRYAMPNSVVLIHQIQTTLEGKFEDLRDDIKNCEKVMAIARKIYRDSTKMPEDVLKKVLTSEAYIGADEMMRYGIVNELYN